MSIGGSYSHELAGTDLECVVLPWRIDDIENDQLLKDKVCIIYGPGQQCQQAMHEEADA